MTRRIKLSDLPLAWQEAAKPQVVKQPRETWNDKYARKLFALKALGFITHFTREEQKLRIGGQVGRQKARWFTPDFFVWVNGRVEVHEVKGPYFRDDAKDRIAAAADRYPYLFYILRLDAGQWTKELVTGTMTPVVSAALSLEEYFGCPPTSESSKSPPNQGME